MKYAKLGNTDIEVSKICLGTMTFGEQNSEAEGHEQMDYALDKGVNLFDTAELYAVPGRAETQGKTEEIIGSWFNARKNRDKVILATKVTGPSPGLKYIRNPLRFDRDQITTALEGSLKRLQTDYIDIYQLHWPERKTNFFGRRGFVYQENDPWEDNFHEILLIMQDFINVGKIRYFGISNETPWGLSHFLNIAKEHDLPRCISVQNPYSLLNRLYEVGMAEMSIRERVKLLAYSPMAFGLLSGKYHDNTAREEARLKKFGDKMTRYNSAQSYDAVGRYLEIAKKHNLSLASLSLAFINQQPFLLSNIIGATTMDQLKENIDSIDIELDKEIIKEINEVHNQIPNPAP